MQNKAKTISQSLRSEITAAQWKGGRRMVRGVVQLCKVSRCTGRFEDIFDITSVLASGQRVDQDKM